MSTGENSKMKKSRFRIEQLKNLKFKNPILIEGLPGIGNVGKVVVDFMIDSLNAEKVFEIHSDQFPNSVFVNEENLIDLPIIEIFYKKFQKNDLLFLAGDIQPLDETACYEFCEEILDIFEKSKGKEIITTGGIGLPKIPNNPEVYCTGNSKDIIKRYKTKKINNDIFGVVGPIVGVSGLLLGLAKRRNIPAIALLAQTYGHPNYLGIKGSKEILKILNKKFNLKLNLKHLDSEIEEIEKELKTKIDKIKKLPKSKLQKTELQTVINQDTAYIG